MSANKTKVIVTVYWKNYVTPSTQFEVDPGYRGYRPSEDGRFYNVSIFDGSVSIPVENVQFIEKKYISA